MFPGLESIWVGNVWGASADGTHAFGYFASTGLLDVSGQGYAAEQVAGLLFDHVVLARFSDMEPDPESVRNVTALFGELGLKPVTVKECEVGAGAEPEVGFCRE